MNPKLRPVCVRRPVCNRCGMVNTITQSGHCVNCHSKQSV